MLGSHMPLPEGITESIFVEITRAKNGFVISAIARENNSRIVRICDYENQVLDELAKVLLEFKLTTKE